MQRFIRVRFNKGFNEKLAAALTKRKQSVLVATAPSKISTLPSTASVCPVQPVASILKSNTSTDLKPDDTARTKYSIPEITSIADNYKKLLIIWSATWCSNCKTMKPFIDFELSKTKHPIKMLAIDADTNPELVTLMKITQLPHYQFIYDNQLFGSVTGSNKDDFVSILKKLDSK